MIVYKILFKQGMRLRTKSKDTKKKTKTTKGTINYTWKYLAYALKFLML